MTYAEKRRRSLLASLIVTMRALEKAHPDHMTCSGHPCGPCARIDSARAVIFDERRALSSDLWRSRSRARRAS